MYEGPRELDALKAYLEDKSTVLQAKTAKEDRKVYYWAACRKGCLRFG
jgi:hypothetical protein